MNPISVTSVKRLGDVDERVDQPRREAEQQEGAEDPAQRSPTACGRRRAIRRGADSAVDSRRGGRSGAGSPGPHSVIGRSLLERLGLLEDPLAVLLPCRRSRWRPAGRPAR